jgi:phosphate transport system substrate-binding protein
MTNTTIKQILTTTAWAFLGATQMTSLAQAQQITGAGASFPAPIYAKWAAE